MFMPEPGGLSRAQVEEILSEIAVRRLLASLGLTGLTADVDPTALVRFCAAAGL